MTSVWQMKGVIGFVGLSFAGMTAAGARLGLELVQFQTGRNSLFQETLSSRQGEPWRWEKWEFEMRKMEKVESTVKVIAVVKSTYVVPSLEYSSSRRVWRPFLLLCV